LKVFITSLDVQNTPALGRRESIFLYEKYYYQYNALPSDFHLYVQFYQDCVHLRVSGDLVSGAKTRCNHPNMTVYYVSPLLYECDTIMLIEYL